MQNPLVSVTCYLEIVSSWCFWAEPVWRQLKDRFPERVAFDWKIALMPPEAFPESRAHCDAFYQRSGMVMQSSFMLNSAWLEPDLKGDYRMPNLVAEAGKDLGFNDDRLRQSLTRAALIDGRKIGRIDEAVRVASEAFGLDPQDLKKRAMSDAVQQRVTASTQTFHAHQIDQRPAFIIQSAIGDKAVFSGVVRLPPLAATVEAMLADCEGYAAFHAHFGNI